MALIKDIYGTKFNDHLLEEYKIFVEMADKVSARRGETNRFYITILSTLLALLSITVGEKSPFSDLQNLLLLGISILGLFLCLLWYLNIRSYKQLNSGKFQVIHEMEKYLPFPCYDREWEILERGKRAKVYFPLTHIEEYIPAGIAIPYLMLLVHSISHFVK